ncbi:MAG: ABC transporter ATP-binding protein [Acetobacteraceae bacterium]
MSARQASHSTVFSTGAAAGAGDPIVDVENLNVTFASNRRPVRAVRGVSFAVRRGETLAIVGESGSGKSTTGLAIMGLLERANGTAVSGAVHVAQKSGRKCDVLRLTARELRKLRGNDVAMIFQEPMSSLNPAYSVGAQIAEAVLLHQRLRRRDAFATALDLLRKLQIPNPDNCLKSYPHQLSGGMRQRVMIAIALSCRPNLFIADEPTTALDVTVQAQILELLKKAQRESGMALLFITHNLGVVSEIADRILVMYAGEVVESGPTASVFGHPRMPYTAALLRSLPRLGEERAEGARLAAIPGGVPSPTALPSGCCFHPRCLYRRLGRCDTTGPQLEPCGCDHFVRCQEWRGIAAATK